MNDDLKESLQKYGFVISDDEEGGTILGFSVDRLVELKEIAENSEDGFVFVHITDEEYEPQPEKVFLN